MKRDRMAAALARAKLLLGEEVEQLLLVGGCVPAQYDLGAVDMRETADVDLVFHAENYAEWCAIERRLVARGFSRPMEEGASLARFVYGSDVLIDVATTPYVSVGKNRWYEDGFRTRARTADGWWVPPPALFLAMKFEAYNDPGRRGHGDPLASIDIEDVFVVLRGVRGLLDELATDPSRAAAFVRSEILKLVHRPDALEVVCSNLEPDDAAQATAPHWLDLLRRLDGATAAPAGRPRRSRKRKP